MTNLEKAEKLYKGKKVLILGLGINQGGVGAARFFAEAGAELVVTDLKTKQELQASIDELSEYQNIEYILGEHRYEDIDWADIIIRNPALKPENPYLIYAQEKGKQVEMDLGIFLEFISPEKIIGITGTKGKSTTSSLIFKVLKDNGVNVVFAGNIGRSMLDTINKVDDQTFVVLELSSFQLQALEVHQKSPKYAVITNILPDHLNYHGSMENYIQAKRFITEFQTKDDYLFLNKDSDVTNTEIFRKGLEAQIIEFSPNDLPEDFESPLLGEHNLYNIAAAVTVAKVFHIEEARALKSVQNFEGVEFRMQLIKEFNGIKIYNDTAATMPQAAIENLKSAPNCILIAGGMNKNLSYQEFAQAIDEYAKSVYFLVGDATDEIKKYLVKTEKVQGEYDNLEQLVKDVLAAAQPGDIVLFSPGATSFNLFKNEFDRGRQFNHAVNKLIS